jgi:hypothetical protein
MKTTDNAELWMDMPRHAPDFPMSLREQALQEAVRTGGLAEVQRAWHALNDHLQATHEIWNSWTHPLTLAVRRGEAAVIDWLMANDPPKRAVGFAWAQALGQSSDEKVSWMDRLRHQVEAVNGEQDAQVCAARLGYAGAALHLWHKRRVGLQPTMQAALIGGHDALACELLDQRYQARPVSDAELRLAIQYRCPQALTRFLKNAELLSSSVLHTGLRTALRCHEWSIAERLLQVGNQSGNDLLGSQLGTSPAVNLMDSAIENRDVAVAIWLGQHTDLGVRRGEALWHAVRANQMDIARVVVPHVKDWDAVRALLLKGNCPDWESLDKIGLLLPPEQQQAWIKQTRGGNIKLPQMVAQQRQRDAQELPPPEKLRRRFRA